MKIYLAESGGVIRTYLLSRRCGHYPALTDNRNAPLYLAGTSTPLNYVAKEKNVDLYLAGTESRANLLQGANLLQSFFFANKMTEQIIPMVKNFMLDSGAFSFLNSGAGKVDWNDYIDRYAAFINHNKVERFLELDIDPIIGYDNVLKLRKSLEQKTQKQCIPVWHKSRGKDEFLRMCSEYTYVAIGGIVTKEITKQEYKVFPWLISEAHKRGAKIHGLGFTNLDGLTKYHFDSVDSTAWVSGNRFGAVYKFNGKTMVKYDKPDEARVKNKETAINNFLEWRKFCDYAEAYL